MIPTINSNYIKLKTDHEGYFKVTITSKSGHILFSENISSDNKEILLKGFSLHLHTVTISPLKSAI